MSDFSYWDECIEVACEEAGVKVTEEQIKIIAGCVDGAHENYGMAFGHDDIPNPVQLENDQLKKDLDREKTKMMCSECRGEGYLITHGYSHSSSSSCHVCRGEGFIYTYR